MGKIDIPRTMLEKGSEGPDVEYLHKYLTTNGYFPNDHQKNCVTCGNRSRDV